MDTLQFLRSGILMCISVIISLTCTQYMAHKGDFPLEERLMAAGMNGAAFAMAYFRFPTVETADSHASALCMASQTMVAVKYIYCTNCTRKIERKINEKLSWWLCSAQFTLHGDPYGPMNSTWEGWASGRWCNNEKRQILTIGRAMDAYRKKIHQDHYYTTCLDQKSADDFRWHGYVTSVPGGYIPRNDICDGRHMGQCQYTDQFTPDGENFDLVATYLDNMYKSEEEEDECTNAAKGNDT